MLPCSSVTCFGCFLFCLRPFTSLVKHGSRDNAAHHTRPPPTNSQSSANHAMHNNYLFALLSQISEYDASGLLIYSCFRLTFFHSSVGSGWSSLATSSRLILNESWPSYIVLSPSHPTTPLFVSNNAKACASPADLLEKTTASTHSKYIFYMAVWNTAPDPNHGLEFDLDPDLDLDLDENVPPLLPHFSIS
ncbi:hypothetical protein BD289DRAFT_152495 [Coniella lustricola]|uniref:Uncharacterized protein n=1 Tax=Coniella lustricola TaxID=2025994 RepID=A0A2T2ZUP1_9PEZI|nr:hypothetical protein BD289DRAFT_152495 [Coniella lustricola]